MAEILLVCSGNTCRSPMAEAILREKALRRAESASWRIASAGIFAATGRPASMESHAVMEEYHINISRHRSRPLDERMVSEADLLITMEGWQRDQLRCRYPEHSERIFSLSELAGDEDEDISDPFGGGIEIYRQTAARIDDLIDRCWDAIMKIFEP